MTAKKKPAAKVQPVVKPVPKGIARPVKREPVKPVKPKAGRKPVAVTGTVTGRTASIRGRTHTAQDAESADLNLELALPKADSDDYASADAFAQEIIAPAYATLADNMVHLDLSVDYYVRMPEDNSVAAIINRHASESNTHNAQLTVIVEDVTAFNSAGQSSYWTDHPIHDANNGVVSEPIAFFCRQAIARFVIASGGAVVVTKATVQQLQLQGIKLII